MNPRQPKRRRRDAEVALHKPKTLLAHLADEYAALGDVLMVGQLRRCLHPRIIVAHGATVTPYRKRVDS